MPANVLTGSSIASFKGIELHRYLVAFTDSRGPRVVTHEFPKRDGAKLEVMGRRPHRSEWQLTFTGPSWISTLRQLVASLDESPSGLLVHPIYGQMQVVCQGFERASVNIPEATDTISVPLTFVEDQLDQGLVDASQVQGVAAQQQNVTSAVSDFQAAVAMYSSAAISAATLAQAATSYASAAALAAQTATVDPSLGSKLDAVALGLEAAVTAIFSDPLGVGAAATYDAIAAAEVVYAACLDLADAVLATGAQATIEFTLPGATSIAVLAAERYGKDARAFIDQILTLNAIPDPTAIPAGTVLLLPHAP